MQGRAFAKAIAAGAAEYVAGSGVNQPLRAKTVVVSASLPAARPRDAHLQGLRGLAMGIVFLGHFSGVYLVLTQSHGTLQGTGTYTWIYTWIYTLIRLLAQISGAQFGSTTFLMIAGFVLYARTQDASFRWKSYLQARILRLIPLYWFALASKVAWEIGIAGRNRLPADNEAAVLYVLQNAFLLFPFSRTPALITVSWTMAYLFVGYLAVPAIARAGIRWKLEFRGRITALVVFAVFWVVVPMFWTRLGWNGLAVAVGMLICELNRKWPLRRWRAHSLDLAAPVAFISGCAFFWGLQNGSVTFPTRQVTFVAFIFVAILPMCLFFCGRLAHGGPLNRLLSSSFFSWLGEVSYAFYLFHGFALLAFKAVMGSPQMRDMLVGPAGFAVALPLSYGVALAVAAVIHYVVELPLNTRLGQFVQGSGQRYDNSAQRKPLGQASQSKPIMAK